MTDLNALTAANKRRWMGAKVTRKFVSAARRLVAPVAREKYQSVSAKTGVPWPIIAVIHERECSQDWSGSLAQGDPWDKVSIHVPAGRGPFASWEDAAVDALVNCPPHAARNTDWSIGSALTKLEEYNGLGYAARGQPSPYVWSGTNQYKSGKYVRDGAYDPDVVDSQLGCAGLLMAMIALDPTIKFADAASEKPQDHPVPPLSPKATAPVAHPASAPKPPQPAPQPSGSWLSNLINAIFRRRR